MKEQAQNILDNNILGVLATVNKDGSPWATPLHFTSDSQVLYWFSAEDRVHSENIARSSRVSVAIFSPDTSQGLRAVYVNGSAQQLDGSGRDRAYALFKERLGSVPATFEGWSAYQLPIGTLNEQKSTGSCWYFYS